MPCICTICIHVCQGLKWKAQSHKKELGPLWGCCCFPLQTHAPRAPDFMIIYEYLESLKVCVEIVTWFTSSWTNKNQRIVGAEASQQHQNTERCVLTYQNPHSPLWPHLGSQRVTAFQSSSDLSQAAFLCS